jgi:hypothetical protein
MKASSRARSAGSRPISGNRRKTNIADWSASVDHPEGPIHSNQLPAGFVILISFSSAPYNVRNAVHALGRERPRR